MGIVFLYLQIDAILKQLHINRDCKCSGLLICNQLSVNICIILRDLSIINPGWGGGLWGHAEFAILWSVNSYIATLSKRGRPRFCQFLQEFADEKLKASTPQVMIFWMVPYHVTPFLQYFLFDLHIVGSVGLHGEKCWVTCWCDGLYGGECWVTWMRLLVTWRRVLDYMIAVLDYKVGCWVTLWGVGLHGGVFGYIVGCWVTWWGVLSYMEECWVTWRYWVTWWSVGLHGEECWVTWRSVG